jgi:hypothetical protein
MSGAASAQGAKMGGELRVLETLRAGRTEEAIRLLEDDLNSDIIVLAFHLRMGDETKTFQTTPPTPHSSSMDEGKPPEVPLQERKSRNR